MQGRQRVKHDTSLSWQPALVLCCFTEVSLWWKIFQWQKTLAAEVIHCCCRNLVFARESQWVRQFWEQQWPVSVPCHAWLVWESVLQDCWGRLYWETPQIRADLDYLPVATMKSLSEAWQTVCYYSLWRGAPGQCLRIISVKLEPSEQMFYWLPHWSLDAFNLYMSILWLNAWVVRRNTQNL